MRELERADLSRRLSDGVAERAKRQSQRRFAQEVQIPFGELCSHCAMKPATRVWESARLCDSCFRASKIVAKHARL